VAVRGRVEVEGVHDVGGVDRVGRDLGGAGAFGDAERRPAAGAHDDHRVGVALADHRDDLFGVALDGGPAHSVGFVGDLVEHVGLAGVALGDFREEGLGPVQGVVGIARGEDVPVHDHVQAARRGHVDELVHPVGEAARVGLVAVFLDVHGQADDVGLPVVGQGVQRAVGQAVVEPLDAVGAHAAQLDRVAVLVAELGAADLDFAVPLDRGAGAGLRAGVGGGGSGTAGAARLGAFVAGGAVDGAVGGFAAAGSDEAEGGGASGRDGAVPGNPGEGVGVAAAGVLGVPHL